MTEFRILMAAALLLAVQACDPPGGAQGADPPLDSLQMLADSLERAWDDEDADLLDWCLSDDFRRNLPVDDWDDYDGDGIIDTSWSESLELQFAGILFDGTRDVLFDLTGDSAAAWPGDPSGESWIIHRAYVLTAAPDSAGGDSLTSYGSAVMACRVDASGILRVWQLWSTPDPSSAWSWTDLMGMPWKAGSWTAPGAPR